MKDTATISYDATHHQQHQHHQHHPSDQHHQLWNHQQRHQHQTHTTSIYGNQSMQATPGAAVSSAQTPRSALSAAQSTQHVHHQPLGQYHQQIQPHNSAPYYQQTTAHLYPTYQQHSSHPQDQQNQQQQQQATLQHSSTEHQQHDHLSHHHHQTNPAPVSIAQTIVPTSIVTPQQQHNSIHHPQNPASTQASSINHGGWPQNIGGIAHQGHHNAVGDHSPMAYMTHGYPNHTTGPTDHQRNSNGTISNQPIGTSQQGNSYSVEALYGNNAVAAAAAAAAAYNYSTNYNAAFFQASNNGHHSSAGHPSQANLSTFWNHNQPTQQQTNHSQTTVNQAQVQQRQPTITSEPTPNYLHDPRLYYGRPAYAQNLQNFGHHSQVTPGQNSDILHHRIATIPQQNQFIQQEQLRQSNQQPQQYPIQQQHHQQAPLQSMQKEQSHQQVQNSSLGQAHNNHAPPNHQTILNDVQGNGVENQLLSITEGLPPSRHFSPQLKKSQPQPPRQNINSDFTKESNTEDNKNIMNDQLLNMNTQLLNNNNTVKSRVESNLNQIQNDVVKGEEYTKSHTNEITEKASLSLSSKTSAINTQKPFKDNVQMSQGSKSTNTVTAQPPQRSSFRNQADERNKLTSPNLSKKPIAERERHTSIGTDSKSSISSSRMQDSDQTSSLEESMMGLTIKAPSRKTTWASIASQPAKIAQPKSLKSKMAGSNLVLSSAKHLVAVSLDSSGLDSKNGINPAIKNSVSAAATSIQRTSLSPPVPKIPAPAAIKLDILGEDSTKSKISWPAVNASIKSTTDESADKLENALSNRTPNLDPTSNDKLKKDDEHLNRDYRDLPFKDQNHNQRSHEKMVNSHQPLNGGGRDFWNRRDQSRDYRVRRDSDRKEGYDFERGVAEYHEDHDKRDVNNPRRDFKPFNSRVQNHLRNDESNRGRGPHREPIIKRSTAHDQHHEPFQNFKTSNSRQESKEHHNSRSPNLGRSITNPTTHHHYNNIRDGVMTNESPNLDVNLHPHLNPENFNPEHFDLEQTNARYFIIKSYSEDDIHRSIKYSIWCSTNHGNKRLDEAFRQQQAIDGPIYLFYSVNGSGHFCGMAQMTSSVDFESSSGVWAQSKWLGEFSVKWLYVKDVPNSVLRHITLENNEDKPVTNSRDTQEVPSEKGRAVLKILHQYTHTSSIFDDFMHYERRQEEEKFKKSHMVQTNNQSEARVDGNTVSGNIRFRRPYAGGRNHDLQGGRERTSRFAS